MLRRHRLKQADMPSGAAAGSTTGLTHDWDVNGAR